MAKELVWNKEFDDDAYALSRLELAAKFVVTIDPNGHPHVTFIAFNRGIAKDKLVWGQFTEGLSKKYVKENPIQGICMMTAEMPFKFIQMKVKFTHLSHEGEDLDYFSRMDLLRYNTYMNAHTAYYNDVEAVTPVQPLKILGLLRGMIANMIGVGALKDKDAEKKLPLFSMGIFNGAFNPKFLAWIGEDGYPVIVPCFQLRAPDRGKLTFTLSQFGSQLKTIPEGAHVCAFGMNFEREMNVVKGTVTEWTKKRGVDFAVIDVTEVYNCQPPIPGVVYPKIDSRPKVTSFKL